MVTPFRKQDQVEHDAAQRNIDRWLKTSISGCIIGSRSGEKLYMSESEKVASLQCVTEALDNERLTVGGSTVR